MSLKAFLSEKYRGPVEQKLRKYREPLIEKIEELKKFITRRGDKFGFIEQLEHLKQLKRIEEDLKSFNTGSPYKLKEFIKRINEYEERVKEIENRYSTPGEFGPKNIEEIKSILTESFYDTDSYLLAIETYLKTYKYMNEPEVQDIILKFLEKFIKIPAPRRIKILSNYITNFKQEFNILLNNEKQNRLINLVVKEEFEPEWLTAETRIRIEKHIMDRMESPPYSKLIVPDLDFLQTLIKKNLCAEHAKQKIESHLMKYLNTDGFETPTIKDMINNLDGKIIDAELYEKVLEKAHKDIMFNKLRKHGYNWGSKS